MGVMFVTESADALPRSADWAAFSSSSQGVRFGGAGGAFSLPLAAVSPPPPPPPPPPRLPLDSDAARERAADFARAINEARIDLPPFLRREFIPFLFFFFQ